jgi:hypothetical protein
LDDINLLHDAGEVLLEPQFAAARRTGVEDVGFEVGDLLGKERVAFVLGVSGLAPGIALAAGVGGRFDQIGRGRLGGGRRVLLGGGKFHFEGANALLEFRDGGLELLTSFTAAFLHGEKRRRLAKNGQGARAKK